MGQPARLNHRLLDRPFVKESKRTGRSVSAGDC
jgi:hypothetical protein